MKSQDVSTGVSNPTYTIRPFQLEDFEMITEWCKAYSENSPPLDTISSSSFILQINNIPALFISILCTNALGLCYLENYCGNPEFKGLRTEAVQYFIQFLETFARDRGYSRLITMAYRPKLIEQFENYGFTKTVSGLSAFVREVKCQS